jgi:hypothetical protein
LYLSVSTLLSLRIVEVEHTRQTTQTGESEPGPVDGPSGAAQQHCLAGQQMTLLYVGGSVEDAIM